ncbi:MAG: hypothetical protein LQ350_001893 [Teloschistes chrysophthalmus]|nr:MAG: hypothetical protein LQ350_001893 [Niorma chrysophthalma]
MPPSQSQPPKQSQQSADTPPRPPSHPCCFTTTSTTGSTPPTRHLFKTLLTVLVGPQLRPFLVHAELFTHLSPFFAAALNPAYTFSSSGTSTIRLPSTRPDDFEYLVQWAYTRTLTHEELVERKHPAYFRLIRLWILADELGVEGLGNAVVDFMAGVADRRMKHFSASWSENSNAWIRARRRDRRGGIRRGGVGSIMNIARGIVLFVGVGIIARLA